jgi:hypothetical protein
VHDIAARRDGATYRRHKSLRWGDAVEWQDKPSGDESSQS